MLFNVVLRLFFKYNEQIKSVFFIRIFVLLTAYLSAHNFTNRKRNIDIAKIFTVLSYNLQVCEQVNYIVKYQLFSY